MRRSPTHRAAAARASRRAGDGAAAAVARLAGARAGRRAGALVRSAVARGRAPWSWRPRGTGCGCAPGPLFGTGHALDDRLRLPFTQPPEVLRTAVGLLARADAEAVGSPVTDAGRSRADPVV